MKIKKLFSLIVLLFVALFAIAQDSTQTGQIQFSENVYLIVGLALGFYETIVRFYPTVKTYSIVTFIVRIVRTIFPDKSTTGQNHV